MARLRGFPSVLAALTVGTLEVTGAATFAATVTATGQFLASAGSAAAPSYSFTSDPDSGIYRSAADTVAVVCAGGYGGPSAAFTINGFAVYQYAGPNNFVLAVGEGNAGVALGSTGGYLRLYGATNIVQVGGVASAAPVAQTFTIGEASRPGTDTNVGGSNGTIRSGLGTGTGTPSKILLLTPTVAASGSDVQTYDSCFVALGGLTSAFPALRRNGNLLEAVFADESNYAPFRASAFKDANNVQVVGGQGAAVADATGAGDVVAQLNTLLARLRTHGLIAT